MAKKSFIFSKTEELFNECLVKALGAGESKGTEYLLSVILDRLKREEIPMAPHHRKTVYERAVLRLYRFYNLRSRGIHIEDAEYYAYDEDDAARDMITIAGNYPKVKDENGHSYYMLVKKSVEGPRRIKPIISLAAIIAGIILIALVIIFKPFGIFRATTAGSAESVESVASGNDSAGADGGYGGEEDAADYSDSGTDTGHSHNNDSGNSDWDSGSGGTVVTFSYEEGDGVGVSEIEME